ncbi:MAG: sensor diguanylate cyclase [Proteobacteria bacterium]|nr:sensor diguanylate cyclase [Pseudomonadota bacterium]
MQTTRTERDEALAEIARLRSSQEMLEAISVSMEIGTLLELLGNKILATEGIDGFVINILDMAGENLICMNLRYPDEFRHLEATFRNYKYPLTTPSPHVTAFTEQRPVALDAETGTEEEREALARWKLRQSLALPISAADSSGALVRVGTVMVFCQNAALTAQTQESLQDLIRVFSVPLCNAQRHAHLLQQQAVFAAAATEQERFLRFVTEVNSLTLPDKIFELILTELMRRMPFDVASLFIANTDTDVLECRKTLANDARFAPQAEAMHTYCVDKPYRLDIQDGGPPHAFIKNIPLVFKDVQQLMHLQLPTKSRKALELLQSPHTLINMPIRFKGKPIGVLMLTSLVEPVTISEADFRFFELLSDFFGAAITNANTYARADEQHREIGRLNLILQDKIDELADQVATDKLTGLFNFRSFEQEILRRLNEYQRQSARLGLSIVMVDIDHFKNFNDNYGHAAGNTVLAGVAHEIAKLSRKMDMACRYGGEEFVVILPKCEAEGALIFAERVRVAVEQARFEIETAVLGVTVSVGAATFVEGDTQQSLFERADQALYRAKRAGRNQVCG